MEHIERAFVVLFAMFLFVYQLLFIYLTNKEDNIFSILVVINAFFTSIICAFAVLNYLK